MAYTKDYNGQVTAIITEAYVFEGVPIKPGNIPSKRFFTHHACWDTGAEVTIISPRVVELLGLEPFEHTSLMGIGGDEQVGVYLIHLGLPNGYLYRNLIVYCSDIDDYDVLIGMNLIAESDFFDSEMSPRQPLLVRCRVFLYDFSYLFMQRNENACKTMLNNGSKYLTWVLFLRV